MSRKWDRIENFVEKEGWDILKCLADNPGDVQDDLDDLIGYLLLVREASTTHLTYNPEQESHTVGGATMGLALSVKP